MFPFAYLISFLIQALNYCESWKQLPIVSYLPQRHPKTVGTSSIELHHSNLLTRCSELGSVWFLR
ncbi:unnamed protein product [Periconia digitata]|uniref:Uncharacterized protein n=1 Tax=Periconia digitata TaxID=1303443 RepID=A0A9W4XTF9_9PLEO|nr:unnamed protein product [Periconia digitata]